MLEPTLLQKAIQRIAEDRIREAEEKGRFDNLPLHGKPLPPLEEGPADAHLISWMRGWIQRERLADAQREARLPPPALRSAAGGDQRVAG